MHARCRWFGNLLWSILFAGLILGHVPPVAAEERPKPYPDAIMSFRWCGWERLGALHTGGSLYADGRWETADEGGSSTFGDRGRITPQQLDEVKHLLSELPPPVADVTREDPNKTYSVPIAGIPRERVLLICIGPHDRCAKRIYDRAFTPAGVMRIFQILAETRFEVWLPTLEPDASFAWHGGPVDLLAAARDGRVLAAGRDYDGFCLWNGGEGRLVKRLTPGASPIGNLISPDCLSPNGSLWVTAHAEVNFFDTRTGQLRARLSGQSPIGGTAVSPDDKLVAVAGDRIDLIEIDTGKRVAQFHHHRAVALFSSNGKRLATFGDRTVRLWNVATAKVEHEITCDEPVSFAAFSADGTLLATASSEPSGTAALWQTEDGKLRATLRPSSCLRGLSNRSIAFSPDGKRFAIGMEGARTLIWDVPSGQQIATLFCRGSNVIHAVLFTPDHKYLYAAGDRISLERWDIGRLDEIHAKLREQRPKWFGK